jgi:uncharacterized protein YlxP (DUF503 family)
VIVGSLRLDLLLGDVHSLKAKRSVVRPIIAEVARRYPVAAAETGDQNLHRRCELGVAFVAGEAAHVRHVLDAVERLVAARPEIEVLSARTRVWHDDDE